MAEQALMNLTPENMAFSITTLTRMIQALGGLIILYLIFGIINLIISIKKNKELKKMSENLKKIRAILSKKKKK
ncbi:hypothetical protein FJZ20_01785 [Candidatus Pacearchaeota archaeon]|nr:hypothetical protein [Candidatus Pacearchaeota archaeon]